MFTKIIALSLLLISTSLSAKEIKVRYVFFYYQLDYSFRELKMTGKGLDLSMKEKPCNEKHLKKFTKSIESVLKRVNKQKTPEKESFAVETDEDKFYQSKTTPAGKFFLSLPDAFKKLKILEELECKDSKSNSVSR